jgi:hypothetical protein
MSKNAWTCQELRRLGKKTIMVNYNPETVSTDYDMCDRYCKRNNLKCALFFLHFISKKNREKFYL